MLELLTDYYVKLTDLNLRRLCPKLSNARIICRDDHRRIVKITDDLDATYSILELIANSLDVHTHQSTINFDNFLTILEEDNDPRYKELGNEMRRDLSIKIQSEVSAGDTNSSPRSGHSSLSHDFHGCSRSCDPIVTAGKGSN